MSNSSKKKSESWAPTPQHRSRPSVLLGSPPAGLRTKAKQMRRSKPCTSSQDDTPTTIHRRDQEVTRRRIILSELNIKRRSNGPQAHQPPVVENANKRGRARLRAEVAAMTPRQRVLSPVLRGSTTCESPPSTPRREAPSLGRLESRDTPQGKRSKVTLTQLPAVVCPEAQKSQLLKWKQ